jgi:hypothetical protein
MNLWRRWDRLSKLTANEVAKRRADEALQELRKHCAPEIAEALNEFQRSSNLLIFDPTVFQREVAEVGVRVAAQTLRDEPGRSLLAYVKGCVVDVLKEAEAAQYEELRNLAPKQLLGI